MKKNVFEKINKYLTKQGHDLIYSVYLDDFNNHNIYVRFDYNNKINVYKMVWYDLDFLDEKNIDKYTNSQMVTSFIGTKLDEMVSKIDEDNKYKYFDENIGDRVEIIVNNVSGVHEYVFQRFLPKDWRFLLDLLVLTFNYLPKSMEVMIDEMLGDIANNTQYYNSKKPIKFDLFNDDLDKYFEKVFIDVSKDVSILYLEKIEDTYNAVTLFDGKTSTITIDLLDNGYVKFNCSCNIGFCHEMVAVVNAIREGVTKPFMKVKINSNKDDLLNELIIGKLSLCCGHKKDTLSIFSSDGIYDLPVIVNGKVSVKVIEDDKDNTIMDFINSIK